MQKTGKFVATIEARMTSSRLPGKVLLPALNKPMIMHLVDRLKAVRSLDDIVIATTTNAADDPLVEIGMAHQIKVYRGSEDDVMARVIGAAKYAGADVIVEITGDCPVIDPEIIDQAIQMYKFHDIDYVSNAIVRSYPDGMDVQIFSLATLEKSESMTNDQLDREHVSLHIRNNEGIFSRIHLIAPPALRWPDLGLTLDEKSDYDLLKIIIESLYGTSELFGCGDIIAFLKKRPELLQINKEVVRKGNS